jgi:transcriptional regulatory protein GAL4
MNQEKNLYMQWTEDSLIDAYFHYHHPSYPIIHEPIFRHKATRWKNNEIKVNSHWQTLYRMVLVCGAFYSCTDHTSSMASIDTEIYKKVNDSFFRLDFFSYGTLEGVQGLAIMACLPIALRMLDFS